MQQRLLLSQLSFTSSLVLCGETESVPRKIGIQEREMLTNPKEGTDDTVVHPINLSTLYLAITLLKPSAFKRSPNSSSYRNHSKFMKEKHE